MAFQNISDEQVSSQNIFTSLEDDTVYISTGSIWDWLLTCNLSKILPI